MTNQKNLELQKEKRKREYKQWYDQIIKSCKKQLSKKAFNILKTHLNEISFIRYFLKGVFPDEIVLNIINNLESFKLIDMIDNDSTYKFFGYSKRKWKHMFGETKQQKRQEKRFERRTEKEIKRLKKIYYNEPEDRIKNIASSCVFNTRRKIKELYKQHPEDYPNETIKQVKERNKSFDKHNYKEDNRENGLFNVPKSKKRIKKKIKL